MPLALPLTSRGLESYLSSPSVPGTGPALARRLVSHFGLDLPRVLEENPERCLEIEGIGPGRARRLAEAWSRPEEDRELILFLLGQGLPAALAGRLRGHFGAALPDLLRSAPYRLQEAPGLAFPLVDRLALGLGTSPLAPERVAAASRSLLELAAKEGHLLLRETTLLRRLAVRHSIPARVARPVLEELAGEGELIRDEGDVYLPSLHLSEESAARDLACLLRTPAHRTAPLPGTSSACPLSFDPQPTDLQLQALQGIQREKLLILTGGPGTGKTTLLRLLQHQAREMGWRVLMTAPTGRAARRLAELSGAPAQTLHRVLEMDPVSGNFRRDRDRPLEVDLLVVDEASMVDQSLLAALLRALLPGSRLLLVGDPDQLPPVGAGEALGQLLASGVAPLVRLDRVFRQGTGSRIVEAGRRVRQGRPLLPWVRELDRGDLSVFLAEDPAILVDELVQRVGRSREGVPRSRPQVLTPTRRGPLGTRRLNQVLQARWNPEGPELEHAGRVLRRGDRVMQRRNDPRRGVSNGDLGEVVSIESPTRLRVRFEVGTREYHGDDLELLDLAYATTIHKAQGGEFPRVALVLHEQHLPLLDRRLLYTALTRAREELLLLASERSLELASSRFRQVRRNSRLARRLRRAVLSGASTPASPERRWAS